MPKVKTKRAAAKRKAAVVDETNAKVMKKIMPYL